MQWAARPYESELLVSYPVRMRVQQLRLRAQQLTKAHRVHLLRKADLRHLRGQLRSSLLFSFFLLLLFLDSGAPLLPPMKYVCMGQAPAIHDEAFPSS